MPSQDLQNMVELEPHIWSHTLAVSLGNDYKIFIIVICAKCLKIHPEKFNHHICFELFVQLSM